MKTPLHEYVKIDKQLYRQYEESQANIDLIAKVRTAAPKIHVVVASRTTCGDCVRNIPQMTRISEHLPSWTWDIFPEANRERMESLNVVAVPTFILYAEEGSKEIGRIIENPVSESLEQDLLKIVSK